MAKAPVFLRPLVRYADFQGRSHRVEFWSFCLLMWLAYACVYGGVAYLFYPVFMGKLTSVIAYLPKFIAAMLAIVVMSLALVIPSLAVQVRRLHDSDRTGWWLVVPFAVSMVGQCLFYILRAHDMMHASMQLQRQIQAIPPDQINILSIWAAEWNIYRIILPWSLAPSLLANLGLLILFLWPGTKGPNRYGDDPRGRVRERVWLFP